jgi:hypothetical protein
MAAEDVFKFPDEAEDDKKVNAAPEGEEDVEVEIVDDTPPEDRGRTPLPKEMAAELDADDLEKYDAATKNRMRQMKKVWHDERRDKESAIREREEAIRFAELKHHEVNELKKRLGHGEQLFVTEISKSATGEVAAAKERLKQAYEAGDADAIADAQEAMTDAKLKLREIQSIRTTRQPEETGVQPETQARAPAPVVDQKAEAWRSKNTWFGTDRKMTGFALGLHQDLVDDGVDPRSDGYYEKVNSELRKAFPDHFEDEDGQAPPETPERTQPRSKAAPVVAPVSRTTTPRRVRLSQSQLALAKRFGLTPEQYAKEAIKLENGNG